MSEGEQPSGASPPPSALCPRCGSVAPILEDGGCPRCRSLVAARTLPLGISAEHRLAISSAEAEREEVYASALRVDPLIGLVIADRYRIIIRYIVYL